MELISIGQEDFLILNSRINRDIHPDTGNAEWAQTSPHGVCGDSIPHKSKRRTKEDVAQIPRKVGEAI